MASASSTYAPAYPVSAINNNERAGTGWGNGGGWADGTPGTFPDWVQITFNGSKTIDRVVVYSVQDNYTQPVEPTDSTTFATYGITAFTVQGWNGTSWITLATVSGNNLVKRTRQLRRRPPPIASASTSPPPAAPAPTSPRSKPGPRPADPADRRRPRPRWRARSIRRAAGASVTFTATVNGTNSDRQRRLHRATAMRSAAAAPWR